jgi:hypothetical protein
MRTTITVVAILWSGLILGCSSPASTSAANDTLSDTNERLDARGAVDAVVFPEIVTKDLGNDVGLDFAAPDLPPDVPQLGCQPGEGCFLDECASNASCQSGWCVEHLGDGVCSKTCQDECPAGWTCQQVAGTEPDVVFICVSDYANLCKPCASNADCGTVGKQDVCLEYGEEGSFCGGGCQTDDDCPWGFSCDEAETVDGATSLQCVNEAGSCPCTGKSIGLGLATPCTIENEFGVCAGHRICTADGLANCDANVPAAETCNGQDDNCNGLVDEATCDDGIQCTLDSCDPDAGCLHEALDNGECTDGNPCTVADHCVAGECTGSPVLCDDSNPCTDDTCNPEGGCLFQANQDDCDDGEPCTVGDHCKASQCVGTDIDCGCTADTDCVGLDNGNLCDGTLLCDTSTLPYQCAVAPESVITCPVPEGLNAPCLAPSCDPETGECSLVPDHEGIACDDGNACTIGEVCTEGLCGGGASLNCNDGNVCTDDLCDPESGCQHVPNDDDCQDGSICTVGDICADGTCQPGKPLQCDDANPCTNDTCDPALGCVHSPNNAPCTDLNPCTSGDHCANGSCVPEQMLDCDDDNPCTNDSCNAGLGCIHSHNQVPCDDGNACTTGDQCGNGWCTGAQLSCNDANICTDDSCDPEVGCLNVSNNILCNDGSVCTTNDQCQDGQCTGEPLACDDDNPCTDDTCSDTLGCLHKINATPCDDGDVCTVNDLCQGGQCTGGGALPCDDQIPCTVDQCTAPDGCSFTPDNASCDDANACTDDLCDPEVGCIHSLNQAPCNDDNPCTLVDVCSAGLCEGSGQVDCDDGNVCTQDSCDADLGCTHAPVAGECDDGNGCTTNDSCQLGECVGAQLPCDDDVACTADVCTAQTGCVSTPDHAACNDGNVCTADICDGDAGCVYTPVDGSCDGGSCVAGECVLACVPDCNGKACGADGCQGSCGSCGDGFFCNAGSCVEAGNNDCNDGNDILWDGCTEGTITEYQANTFTPGDQTYPDVTGLTNSRYVIVWNSFDQDGSQYGVFGQLYETDGSVVGAEFQVNTYTESYQYMPKVAPLGQGRFVVVWQGANQEGDGQYHVYTQRFNADGTKSGSESRMDLKNSSPHDNPAIGGRTDDSLLVAWSGHPDLNSYGIFHRAFDDAGTAVSGEVNTNGELQYNQYRPDIASHPEGYIAVWESNGQDGSGYGVYGRRVDTTGNNVGNEIKVHTYTQQHQRYPRVAAYADGGFVAVWESSYEDASGTGVYCQRFKPDGTKINNPFRVNTYIVSNQERPDLSAWSDGRFVVTWTSYQQDGEDGGIFAQRYNSDGTPAGKEFQVNSYTAYTQQYPAVSTIPGAGFVIVWNSQAQDGSVSGVFAQRYDAAGNKLYH